MPINDLENAKEVWFQLGRQLRSARATLGLPEMTDQQVDEVCEYLRRARPPTDYERTLEMIRHGANLFGYSNPKPGGTLIYLMEHGRGREVRLAFDPNGRYMAAESGPTNEADAVRERLVLPKVG